MAGLLLIASSLASAYTTDDDLTHSIRLVQDRGGRVVHQKTARFGTITVVTLTHCKLDPGDISIIGKLTPHFLLLGGTNITDTSIQEIIRIKNIIGLALWSTRITDEGIKRLSVLDRLEYLNLSNTDLTDSCLEQLRRLKRLRTLLISATRVSGRGLRGRLKS
jgi:hypothetical protein